MLQQSLLVSHFQERLNSSDIHNHTWCRYYVLLTQYGSGDQTEEHEVDGACSTYGGSRGVYRVLAEKLEGKRPLGRPRHRWKDNIKIDVLEVGCGGINWIDVAQ